MSESYSVHCDFCQADISIASDQKNRVRVMEEARAPYPGQAPQNGELDRSMNFCNLDHLKSWLVQR